MKKMILFSLLLIPSTALCAGFLEKDASQQNVVQGFAPNGTLAQLLTVNSTTVDMSGRLAFALYPPSSGCKVRQMATSAKGANIQTTVPAESWIVRVVNRSSPFVNMSGCTSAELHMQ